MAGIEPDLADDAATQGEMHLSRSFMDAVREAIRDEDEPGLKGQIADLHAADIADILEALSTPERETFARCLEAEQLPELITELEGEAQDQFLDALPNEQIAEMVGELETDDAIEVLEELKDSDRDEVLEALDEGDRAPLERSLGYPEDSAGRLMQTSVVALPEYWTIGQAIDFLRGDDTDIPADFYDVIVVDPFYRPIGTVPVSRVLRTPRKQKLADVMTSDPYKVDALTDQEDVAYQFNKYHLISAAVVDDAGRLLGVITVDDVIDVIGEEANEDILALAGVSQFGFSERLIDVTKGRMLWLTVNLLTAILASLIIGLFEHQIQALVALAVLMPIVASMGGNAGTQTMTVIVRALATKELSGVNAPRIIFREVMMALANGLLLGGISGAIAYLWFGDWMLAVIFTFAMAFNMLTAALSGVLLPMGLARVGADPAVSSSVFVTTITDVVGFFAFLGLAAWVLL